MTDVTRNNFEDLLPRIQKEIQACSFIAFDAEFSALNAEPSSQPSLFDDGAGRYGKIRSSAQKSFITQIGLSMFKQCNFGYEAATYNFYLCPRSFSSIDPRFLFQSSSFEFLARHNFDFNKVFHEGISFLNQTQEKQLRNDIEQKSLAQSTERNLSFDEASRIEEICKALADISKDECYETDIGALSPGAKYILHDEVQLRFPHLSSATSHSLDKFNVYAGCSQEFDLKAAIVNEMLGFSRVMREIIRSQKVIVGHNCLSDLARIYQQFIDELPANYEAFKAVVHEAFPQVYDTKHLAFCSRRQFEATDKLSELADHLRHTSLGELHLNIREPKLLASMQFYMPEIAHSENSVKYLNHPDSCHEAGYDAFMSGSVFVKIAHSMAALNYISHGKMRPLKFSEQLGSILQYCNMINLGRGSISYIDLAQCDPKSERPTCLFVTSKDFPQTRIAQMLARYGSVDVKQISQHESIVAVPNQKTAQDILLAFQNDTTGVHVTKYRPWKHNKQRKRLLFLTICTGSVLSGIVLLLALAKKT